MAQAKTGNARTGSAKTGGAKKGSGGAAPTGSAPDGSASDGSGTGGDPVTIKKYANRRLYNTATSSYVTLDHLSQMIREGIDFAVFDAKTGDDITRSVLTQIIVEEEAKSGQNLLPISFLRSLIGYYGDNMHRMMLPQYLDFSIRSFSENQEKMQDYMQETFGAVFPFGQLEELGKQNMAMFEKTMQMFSPFPDSADTKREQAADRVAELERKLAEAQAELAALKSNS